MANEKCFSYCLLLTAYCLLLTAYCLLLTAHCSLRNVIVQQSQFVALLADFHAQQVAH